MGPVRGARPAHHRPRGWDLVRHPDIDVSAEDSDLTALLDAVAGGPVGGRRAGVALVDADRLRRLGVSDPTPVLAEEPVEPSGSRPHLRVVPNANDPVDSPSAEPADGARESDPELG
ncbi:hypothetical protein [Dietzia sp. JS16-p6b]|uniref:hypothetical protein n=1 Tax=Dietzia sp. JS16-p6b TaxID=2052657 RepID=UPI0026AE5B13